MPDVIKEQTKKAINENDFITSPSGSGSGFRIDIDRYFDDPENFEEIFEMNKSLFVQEIEEKVGEHKE